MTTTEQQLREELRVAPMTAEQFKELNVQDEITKQLDKMHAGQV